MSENTTPEPDHTDPEWLRHHYIEQNRSQREIGELAGVGRDTVAKHLDRHDIRKPQILKNLCRGAKSPEDAVTLEPEPATDETVLMQVSYMSHKRYHKNAGGTPACGKTTDREPEEWDREEADVWADPCSVCYPDQDSTGDSDE